MTASENNPERRWIERLPGRLGRGVAAEIQALGEVGRGRERQGTHLCKTASQNALQ